MTSQNYVAFRQILENSKNKNNNKNKNKNNKAVSKTAACSQKLTNPRLLAPFDILKMKSEEKLIVRFFIDICKEKYKMMNKQHPILSSLFYLFSFHSAKIASKPIFVEFSVVNEFLVPLFAL